VRHEVLGRRFEVAAGGFWQVHPGAATALAAAVLAALEPRPGERALDLYAGVGCSPRCWGSGSDRPAR
jgi:tRNA/tmRNA/rRNA uracil-C5-methylase (TrmA/RlmC/RlmD family)